MFRLRLIAGLACALLLSAPLVACAHEAAPDTAFYDTAQPAVQVASATQVQISRSIGDIACTSEAASTDSFGALPAYTFSDTASAGTQQRSEVAAATRPVVG